MVEKYCTECGHRYDIDEGSCPECGARAPQTVKTTEEYIGSVFFVIAGISLMLVIIFPPMIILAIIFGLFGYALERGGQDKQL